MKTKTTHTPGPWKIGDVRSQSTTIETVATHHVNSVDPMSGRDLSGERAEIVARVFRGPNTDMSESEANARLIAAAPELLVALIKADKMLACMNVDEESREPIRAAIAKAGSK